MGHAGSVPQIQTSDTKVLNEAKPGFNLFPDTWIDELKADGKLDIMKAKPKKVVRIQSNPTIHELTSTTQSSTVGIGENSQKSAHPVITGSRESSGFGFDVCYDSCYDPCYDYGYGYGGCYDYCAPVYSPYYVPPPVVVAAPPPPVYVQQQQRPVVIQQQQQQPRVIQQSPAPTKFMIKDPKAPGGVREVTEDEVKQGKYKIKQDDNQTSPSQFQQAPVQYQQTVQTPLRRKRSRCCGCCVCLFLR